MTSEKLYEALGNVQETYIEEAEEYRRAGAPAWLKWGGAAACLCLVLAGMLAAGWSGRPGTAPGPGEAQTAPTAQLVVNQAEGTASVDMDVQYTHYQDRPAPEREAAQLAFGQAVGLDYGEFAAALPEGWTITGFFSVDVPADPSRRTYVPHDYVLACETAQGGTAELAVCAAEPPLRDLFFLCDRPEQSVVNGVSLLIHGYGDRYLTQFSHGGINYDIETAGVTLEELETLLTCITALPD